MLKLSKPLALVKNTSATGITNNYSDINELGKYLKVKDRAIDIFLLS